MTRSDELDALHDHLLIVLDAAHGAREVALAACRRTIRTSGNSIRAVHRGEVARAKALADEAADALREAQSALEPFPRLAAAGPLHDAEKEYAEARLTAALVDGDPLPGPSGPAERETPGPSGPERETRPVPLDVSVAAWLCGLAEAASELRRYLLDRLREGDVARAEELLGAMNDVYDMLVTVDYPDAVTGGLRRTTDALRAVLERTRGDLTTSVLQNRLQAAIEHRLPPERR